jgi:threonyl-tRNA synthetase
MVLKPMNCPHHTRIYASQPRSYRDLPLRYLETATVYRDEKTGELGGLSRVRAVTQDDSHVFCAHDQIELEINNLLKATRELYLAIGMKLRVRLSYRDDSDAYLGSKELWVDAQKQLKNAVVDNKLDYFEQDGEAAFYGPKIDFMATDALGREHQVATIQLDFVQPERFGLKYTDEDSAKKVPVMIHCALLGSIERFLSVYIEHTAGRFPLWMSPEQLRIITLNQTDEVEKYANEVLAAAKRLNLRATLDNSNASVSKKIRNSELMKIPYTVVIGSKEIETNQVTPRIRQDLRDKTGDLTLSVEELLAGIRRDYSDRAMMASL